MKIHKQGGLSLVGFIFVLILGLLVAFLGMKIGPVYMEYYSVVTAMKSLASNSGSARSTPREIRQQLRLKLDMNYSSNVEDKHIKITRGTAVNLRVAYEFREPIIGNLDVIMKFDKSVRLTN